MANLLGLSRDSVDDLPQDVWRLDQLLQDVALRREREPVVEHLVEDLVDHHQVLFYRCFGAVGKVVFERVHDAVKELDHEQRRH